MSVFHELILYITEIIFPLTKVNPTDLVTEPKCFCCPHNTNHRQDANPGLWCESPGLCLTKQPPPCNSSAVYKCSVLLSQRNVVKARKTNHCMQSIHESYILWSVTNCCDSTLLCRYMSASFHPVLDEALGKMKPILTDNIYTRHIHQIIGHFWVLTNSRGKINKFILSLFRILTYKYIQNVSYACF